MRLSRPMLELPYSAMGMSASLGSGQASTDSQVFITQLGVGEAMDRFRSAGIARVLVGAGDEPSSASE